MGIPRNSEPSVDKVSELEQRLEALERLVSADVCRIQPDVLYRVGQTAAFLGSGLSNTYDLLLSGELARTRIGAGSKGLRVRGSDILAFLDSRREGGPRPQGAFKFLPKSARG
jgi:hypothetical protein